MAGSAAKRYAQAVLGLAKERGTLDAWQADLARLGELLENQQMVDFFANPGVPTAEKDDLLQRVLADAQPEMRNLARLLSDRGRLELLPQIARLYDDGLRAERGIVVAEVTTAEPLGLEEQRQVGERLAQITGRGVELRLTVDPEIIGGIVARIGDQLIDGSVISQLRRLRARLAAPA
ncbi:MAG: ATP synthase delta chain [uncultured Thermomicrobiales bacterium]|uniref:ATP synthase subunit delta n=1 Tax=uncultured Thermomicrobiales bacterium TaxID=1645740 RepID=A0A6J4V8W5_9BACT|nr:MAG: ATP synthase delta chain [uncultured Thermomicrobiales bacterium]